MKRNLLFRVAYMLMAGAVCGATLERPALAEVTPPAPPRARCSTYVLQRTGSYLGVGVVDVTAERAKALNLKEERGVEVTSVVDDGPAAKAGVKEGDVVLEYNGQAVQGTE